MNKNINILWDKSLANDNKDFKFMNKIINILWGKALVNDNNKDKKI